MAVNALRVSTLYLGLGASIAVVRLFHPSEWLEVMSMAMDTLPARVLHVLGLLSPLRRLYMDGEVSGYLLRLAFASTALALIFTLAFVLGGLAWGAMRLIDRGPTTPAPAPPGSRSGQGGP